MRMARFQPEGWPTITPRLFTADVAGLVAFIKAVFDAEGELRAGRPCELRIGDSMIMVSDGAGLRAPSAAFLYVYVADVDAAFARAIAGGGDAVEAPVLTHYGDRRAMVTDPWGNTWQIATTTG
jgi:PhnB protein